ncbi:ibr domain containing protein [Stylonychia lemnae]|uniref:Ibr domain containing protein n=1 Tax=Stylonychia lemnae TaxID=5949 RepID=A0A078A430_STYLE|nr:ibr domain containing protein [Stylonychia lemnae]|eukprot:CDW76283.1 ibr domain containing protein [Stylonychia lemnae]
MENIDQQDFFSPKEENDSQNIYQRYPSIPNKKAIAQRKGIIKKNTWFNVQKSNQYNDQTMENRTLKSEVVKIDVGDSEEQLTLYGKANCPKCKVEFEKTERNNQISCKNCQHEFCWNCGLNAHHFIHAEWMCFIRCKQSLNIKPNLKRSCGYYFLTLILLPLILFFASFILFCVGGIMLTLHGYHNSVKALREEQKMMKVFYMILLIPSLIFTYLVAVVTGLLFSPIFTAIGLVPAQFLYFYLFIKMALWRSRLKIYQNSMDQANY